MGPPGVRGARSSGCSGTGNQGKPGDLQWATSSRRGSAQQDVAAPAAAPPAANLARGHPLHHRPWCGVVGCCLQAGALLGRIEEHLRHNMKDIAQPWMLQGDAFGGQGQGGCRGCTRLGPLGGPVSAGAGHVSRERTPVLPGAGARGGCGCGRWPQSLPSNSQFIEHVTYR
jgi:hypothetical protein